MKRTSTALCGLISGLLVFAAGISSTLAVIVTIPAGLNPGDKYRLVFVTDGTRDATSSDISVYNAFVAAEAAAVTELNDLGAVWTAIGSTITVDARDNTGTTGAGVVIYGLDGVKIVDDNNDLWDGSLDTGIYRSPSDTDRGGLAVWTGTGTTGEAAGGHLGAPFVEPGDSGSVTGTWVFPFSGLPSSNQLRLYGISSEITVVPEPSRALLSLVGIAAIGLRRRRS